MLKNNSEFLSGQQPEKPVRQETVAQDLVDAYQKFAHHFSFEPKVVYYPSSSTDASPSAAFPESRVIYVDIDPEAIEVLKRSQREAIEASALTYILDQKADLLILLNPAIGTKMPVRQVRLGGFVLCNNWHSSATQVSQNDQFELAGMIFTGKDKGHEPVVDKSEAQRLWNEGIGQTDVDNFYIFQRVKPDPQTDEEALAEYNLDLEQKRKDSEAFLSQFQNQGVDLDDI